MGSSGIAHGRMISRIASTFHRTVTLSGTGDGHVDIVQVSLHEIRGSLLVAYYG